MPARLTAPPPIAPPLSPAPLELTVVDVAPGEVLVAVRGELELVSVARLERSLTGLVACAEVTLDLSGVTFVDCVALRVLLRLLAAHDPPRLVVAAGSAALDRLVDLVAGLPDP